MCPEIKKNIFGTVSVKDINATLLPECFMDAVFFIKLTTIVFSSDRNY